MGAKHEGEWEEGEREGGEERGEGEMGAMEVVRGTLGGGVKRMDVAASTY